MRDILSLVEQPSVYLGSEKNTIRNEHSNHKLKIALAFPDLYEIGTSHFGLQILYYILNQHPEVAAERIYAPGLDMAHQLQQAQIPLMSLESRTPLKEFDLIGFSLLYELNYTNILAILDLAGIPFYFKNRDNNHPIIIAGGTCTVNPEPVADFFDAMVIGDGEEVVLAMAEKWLQWQNDSNRDKSALLKSWSDIKGVYVPSFYKRHYSLHRSGLHV